ncbi:MAG: hypothetical protein DMG94_12660 [Acidobacteria bacterium]|nr:MAG: hypothetical protein DMG94_12660 [Acidobacteriota bacterium]
MRRLTDQLHFANYQARVLTLAAICCVLASATGCWVQSVYPFYEDSDVIIDNKLVGDWSGQAELKDCSLRVSLDATSKSYTITLSGGHPNGDCRTNSIQGKLVQLGQQRFLDVVTADDKSSPSLETLLRVESNTQQLTLTPLDAEWTADALTRRSSRLPGSLRRFKRSVQQQQPNVISEKGDVTK